jgi:hypothetical protein
MFKRIIKQEIYFTSKNIETLNINSSKIHPITLQNINTNNKTSPICLTKMHISNNNLNIYDNYICNGENKYNEYMHLPPVSLLASDLLTLYEISNVDNLKIWINEKIEFMNLNTIKRVLKCWIIENIDDLKKHNEILNEICEIILNKLENFNKIDKTKMIKYFVEYWIQNFNIEENNEIITDLIKYINKKNKS